MAIVPQTSFGSKQLKLVLLPGMDGTGELFQSLLGALPPDIEAIVIRFPDDLLGGYEALEGYVRPLLPESRFALLGESFSGPLALRLASDPTVDICAVILAASFVERPVPWLPRWARHLICPALFRFPFQRHLLRWLLLGSAPSEELVARTTRILASANPDVLADRARAALSVNATEALLRCRAAMLYIGGAQDHLLGSQTPIALKSLHPDLEVVMLQAPHFVLQRSPQEAAQVIAEFLIRHRPAPR